MHSVCFRKRLAEFEAEFEANPLLLHISYFSRSVRPQMNHENYDKKNTQRETHVLTAELRLAERFIKVDLTIPSGEQL